MSRTAANVLINTDRLGRLVINKMNFRLSHNYIFAIFLFEFGFYAGPHHLLGRYAIHMLADRVHECDATTGNNKSLEAQFTVTETIQHSGAGLSTRPRLPQVHSPGRFGIGGGV